DVDRLPLGAARTSRAPTQAVVDAANAHPRLRPPRVVGRRHGCGSSSLRLEALYLLDRSRSRGSGQPMKRFTDFADLPWWLQASVFALIGGGTLYHFATHQDRWYWWLLPTAAWLAFAAVVRRKPQ